VFLGFIVLVISEGNKLFDLIASVEASFNFFLQPSVLGKKKHPTFLQVG
jgi:hypothetical protein